MSCFFLVSVSGPLNLYGSIIAELYSVVNPIIAPVCTECYNPFMVTDELQGLRKSGWSDTATAEAFGTAISTVFRWRTGLIAPDAPEMVCLAVESLKRRKPPGLRRSRSDLDGERSPPKAEDAVQALQEMHGRGWSDAALGAAIGVSRVSVSGWRRGTVSPAAPGLLALAVDALGERLPPSGKGSARTPGVRRARVSRSEVGEDQKERGQGALHQKSDS